MKKTILKRGCNIFVIGLFIMFLLPSCEKYEEGPSISFRSAEKRMFGSYEIKEYTVNGVDSLLLLDTEMGGLKAEFYYNEVSAVNSFAINGGSALYWHWHFSDDEMQLIVDQATGLVSGTGPFGPGVTGSWDILMLKNKKIKLRTTYQSKEYVVLLEE